MARKIITLKTCMAKVGYWNYDETKSRVYIKVVYIIIKEIVVFLRCMEQYNCC